VRLITVRPQRAFMRFTPFVLALVLIAGCATNEPQYTALNDGSGLEKKQLSPTVGMTAGQKTLYYLGWFSLAGFYGWAGAPQVPLSPP
jgi:hypothetical protein